MKLRAFPLKTASVLALLAGTKSQHRAAIMKDSITLNHADSKFVDFTYSDKTQKNTLAHFKRKGSGTFFAGIDSKFGGVGDILWVQESFFKGYPYINDGPQDEHYEYIYFADTRDTRPYDASDDWCYNEFGPDKRDWNSWKPSTQMPLEACRLFLQIESVCVERLQAITEADAIAEGTYCYSLDDPDQTDYKNYLHKGDDDWGLPTAVKSYETLWQSINGPESWAANPFVWVVEFKRVEKPAL